MDKLETSNGNILEDLEELDPTEFDIPDVEEPSLESILKEAESETEDNVSLLDNITNGFSPTSTGTPEKNISNGYLKKSEMASLSVLKSLETTSIKSGDSQASSVKKKDAPQFHGPVLAFYRMQALSNHIMSSADRINAGKPTSLAVSQLIAIGTAHGIALVFDNDQKLVHVLGSVSVGSKYGSVTALAFNMDSDRLLVGYARGQILMYDVKSGKLLRTITDAHPPGSSVLHVKFTDDPTLAVCNDSGGSVFELNFRRVMGVRSCESRCLFSGSRGEVCTIEPLHILKTIADHPLRDRHLLAMGTLTKVLVVSLRPQIKVLFSHQLNRNMTNIPLISWRLSVFVESNTRSIDPVLLFARGDVIYFFQVKNENWDNILFSHIRTMNTTYTLINVAWLNTKTILCLDSTERLHVVDEATQAELETILLENVNLVYSSATFKSIATGGNVSKALAAIGEQTCYHSMISYNGTVLLLGDLCVYATKVRQWNDRIRTSLGWPNGHQRALELALTFYNGTAKSVLGLPVDQEKRRQLVSEMILDILIEYVDLSMTKLCPDNGKLEVLIAFFKDVVPVCVDHCLHINRIDVLCDRIYERFKADCIAHTVFLECLEPYILDDRLKTISPIVMQDFVKHYEAKNMLSNVEACLLHLDVASLDLHQVLSLCWSHGLYDAILSINNRVMSDYVGPLVEMISMLTSAMAIGKQLSDNMTKLGSKLLVYVSSCFAGVQYPSGMLDPESSMAVKKQIYGCLTTPKLNVFTEEYPVLAILLKFSTQEMLNVLSLSFSEPEFQGQKGCGRVQQLVDILLRIMVETPGFTPDQIGTLFVFLARQVARRQDDQQLRVNRMLIQQIVEYLTSPLSSQEESSKHEERQQALVELLQSEVIGNEEDSVHLMKLVERAGFYHALRLLYDRNRRFDLIFETYLKDPAKKEHAFRYIRDTLQDKTVDEGEKDLLVEKVSQNIKELIKIDSDQTANLVTTVLHGSLQTVAAKLKDQPQMLYFFLKGLFNPSTSHFHDADNASLNGDLSIEPEGPNPYTSDPEMVQVYLSLMCQFDRNKVLQFLKSLESNRPSNSIEIVRRYHVDEATAYLLEENDDCSAAFMILHKVAKDKLQKFVERCENDIENSVSLDTEKLMAESKSIFESVIGLCQRSSSKLSEEQMEKLWFPLLDTVVSPRREITSDSTITLGNSNSELEKILKELAQHVLTSMMSHMSLPALLQKIIQDPAYDTGNFGEIKEILLGMLETYQYEKTLLDTTLNLLSRDRHESLSSLKKFVVHGIAPRSQYCAACRESILGFGTGDKGDSNIVIFGSGTVYHESCLKFDPAISPVVQNQPPSPYESPGRSRRSSNQTSLMNAMKPQEKRVVKERRNYVDRKRQINNVSKIFLSAKGGKESSQTQGQRIFRREGSLFAVPVPQNSRNDSSKVDDAKTYSSKIRTLSLKSGELQPQDFKLSVAAPARFF
ncbi:vacuolar protein sorting-associated protein 8 homolog [Styela clava]